ncbi:MAG: CHRD domain-containing protein [Chitinophagaceae bacterium]|nr:CHRD domain-containing protein [Chitinophagaceae bacterium]
MKKLLSASVTLVLILLLSSCTKQKVFNRTYFHTILASSNEVPARVSAGYGDASGFFDNESKILTLTINYVGLRAPLTAWHIHKAAAGVNGGVVFNFGTPQPSGFIYTSAALTAEQEADLMNGLNYVNLHSSVFPGGELRGQLRKY